MQKLKIKTLESLAKIRAGKATDGDSELIDDWIKAVEGVRMMTKTLADISKSVFLFTGKT